MIEISGELRDHAQHASLFKTLGGLRGLSVETKIVSREELEGWRRIGSERLDWIGENWRSEPPPEIEHDKWEQKTQSIERLNYHIRVADVSNKEFDATILDWIHNFVSLGAIDEEIGYRSIYRKRDYDRMIGAMVALDPILREFKSKARIQSQVDRVLICALVIIEQDMSHTVGFYRHEIGPNYETWVKSVTVSVKYPEGGYYSNRGITGTFIHELAHHVARSENLVDTEDEAVMLQNLRHYLPNSFIPGLFEELIREDYLRQKE